MFFHDLSYYEPTSWAWDFGDGSPVVTGERYPVHRFDSAGVYKVCLTVGNTNGTDTHCKTLYIGTVKAGEPTWAIGFSLQPNPTSGQLSAIFPETMREDGQITVFDATGRKVSAVNFTGESRVELDLSALPDGLYSVRVQVGREGLMRKIVVAK